MSSTTTIPRPMAEDTILFSPLAVLSRPRRRPVTPFPPPPASTTTGRITPPELSPPLSAAETTRRLSTVSLSHSRPTASSPSRRLRKANQAVTVASAVVAHNPTLVTSIVGTRSMDLVTEVEGPIVKMNLSTDLVTVVEGPSEKKNRSADLVMVVGDPNAMSTDTIDPSPTEKRGLGKGMAMQVEANTRDVVSSRTRVRSIAIARSRVTRGQATAERRRLEGIISRADMIKAKSMVALATVTLGMILIKAKDTDALAMVATTTVRKRSITTTTGTLMMNERPPPPGS